MSARNRLLLLPLVPVLAAAWLTPAAAAPPPGPCANQAAIHVPGAEVQRVECQTDLSATALAAKGRSAVTTASIPSGSPSRSCGSGIR